MNTFFFCCDHQCRNAKRVKYSLRILSGVVLLPAIAQMVSFVQSEGILDGIMISIKQASIVELLHWAQDFFCFFRRGNDDRADADNNFNNGTNNDHDAANNDYNGADHDYHGANDDYNRANHDHNGTNHDFDTKAIGLRCTFYSLEFDPTNLLIFKFILWLIFRCK